LSDIFEAQKVAPRFLLRLARRRRLFLSEKASKEDLVHALCMAPISWDDANTIADAINKEDRDSRQMAKRLTGDLDFDGVPTALERVKGWLEENHEC
jgi:hypothetical protein